MIGLLTVLKINIKLKIKVLNDRFKEIVHLMVTILLLFTHPPVPNL